MQVDAAECAVVIPALAERLNIGSIIDRLALGKIRHEQTIVGLTIGFHSLEALQTEAVFFRTIRHERHKQTRIRRIEIVPALRGDVDIANKRTLLAKDAHALAADGIEQALFTRGEGLRFGFLRIAGDIQQRGEITERVKFLHVFQINMKLRGKALQIPIVNVPISHGSIPL